jgi:hypothetical protein
MRLSLERSSPSVSFALASGKMKFADPLTVRCPASEMSSEQHPDALLDLHAFLSALRSEPEPSRR